MSSNLKNSKSAVVLRFPDPYLFKAINEAATLMNMTRTGYIISVLREAAEITIKKRKKTRKEIETLILSSRASKQVAEALLNPPKPNKALQKAIKNYGKTEVKYV